MSKVAYHRMLVGGLDVVKRAKRWNTIGPSQKRQPFKGARKKCNEIVLSMCTAQCGSMEAKALSFVLRAAGSEHHQSSTRRVFTYVVGGRVGMNDTCYFTLDMQKLPYPTLLSSPLLSSALLYSTLYSLLFSSLLFYVLSCLKLRNSEVSHPNFLWLYIYVNMNYVRIFLFIYI